MKKFKTVLSPLKLLKAGERGIVIRLSQTSDAISQKLTALGIANGSLIKLEQRFPRYILRIGSNRIAVSDDVLGAVYVRVIDH